LEFGLLARKWLRVPAGLVPVAREAAHASAAAVGPSA